MRNPPQDSGNVKRFSYKQSNSSDDVQNVYQQKDKSSVDNASKSLLGSSDMDVIWSVRKNDKGTFKDKLSTISPPPMTGFYSRYSSQDPRFKSLIDNHEKDSFFGQQGGQNQYSFSQKKASYSYSQENRKQQRYSEPSNTFNNGSPQVTTQKKHSQQDYSGKSPYGNREAGGFDGPSSPSYQKKRPNSNSWDDFF